MGLETERSDRWTLGEIDEGSLAASAFIAAGEEEFYRVKDTLKLMGLPIPQYGAYYSQPNSDRFYRSDLGLVGTVVYRRRNPFHVAAQYVGLISRAKAHVFESAFVETDEVLQPLLKIELSKNAVLEINAGVGGVPRDGEKLVRTLKQTLNKQGLLLVNNSPETVGIIPDAAEEEPLTLIRNRRAVIIQKSGVIEEEAVRQARIFGGLREEFAAAWQSGRQEKFRDLFQKCAGIVGLPEDHPERILKPYWAEERQHTLRQREIAMAAAIYSHQCRVS